MLPDLLMGNTHAKSLSQAWLAALIGLFYAGSAVWLVPGYFAWDWNVYLALAIIPVIVLRYRGERSVRYLIPAIVAVILAILLPVKTALFTAMLLAVLLLVESSWGKVNPVILFLILLVSPVCKHITRLFELPVRLWLSEQAANVLKACGKTALAVGNQIAVDGYEFAVDPACAGLNMLVTSLLICFLVIAIYQHKLGKALGFIHLLLLTIMTIALNIVSNFLRILMLVLFKAMPDTVMHDAIGLLCLTLYVLMPILYIIQLAIRRFGSDGIAAAVSQQKSVGLLYPLLHFCLLIAFTCAAYHRTTVDTVYRPAQTSIQVAGYQKSVLPGGILKLHNASALVYLKPTAFYAPEHDPTVCWVGSGYRFKSVKKEKVDGVDIYTGVLEKGHDRIYTAWWFDDGTSRSVDQLHWRWQALKNDKLFYLINVNTANQTTLRTAVKQLLVKNIFNLQFYGN
ncbi:exosortase N [Mucilaginibacter sp. Bleaf8]|uniref:exosortase N n=1 Tax=Mucilaginibacter sp. Bleaf8 TaxID=2834430 RepID=UPI001BCD43C4|nr:exosortase N [Mucilaginibacter sp. Bleaf8]MBS7563215.1 exosortase N [Mucilaginibacter sp. Bleaf8]